jgi:hypothetical protein
VDNVDRMTGDATMAFAAVKYWSRAKKGPREPGVRPADIQAAAEKMVDAIEEAWRAGCNRAPDMQREVIAIIRRRKQNGE